jgi:hypothetical protein
MGRSSARRAASSARAGAVAVPSVGAAETDILTEG